MCTCSTCPGNCYTILSVITKVVVECKRHLCHRGCCYGVMQRMQHAYRGSIPHSFKRTLGNRAVSGLIVECLSQCVCMRALHFSTFNVLMPNMWYTPEVNLQMQAILSLSLTSTSLLSELWLRQPKDNFMYVAYLFPAPQTMGRGTMKSFEATCSWLSSPDLRLDVYKWVLSACSTANCNNVDLRSAHCVFHVCIFGVCHKIAKWTTMNELSVLPLMAAPWRTVPAFQSVCNVDLFDIDAQTCHSPRF